MKLKDKLKIFAMDNHIEKYAEHNAKELEKIADEFAIGFASYLDDILRNRLLVKEIKGLLEIYKKEKGLL